MARTVRRARSAARPRVRVAIGIPARPRRLHRTTPRPGLALGRWRRPSRQRRPPWRRPMATAATAPASEIAAEPSMAGRYAGGERGRGAEVPVGREHRGHQRDAERTAEPLHRVAHPGGPPDVAGRHRAERGGRHGRHRHRDADAGDHERQHVTPVAAGPADASAATQARPAACSASPVTSSGRVPIRSASAPATGATSIGVAVHGSSRSPGGQRRVAEAELEVLRGEEGRRHDRAERHEPRDVGRRERAAPEQPQRQHRLGRPPFPRDEAGEHGEPAEQRRPARARRPSRTRRPGPGPRRAAPRRATKSTAPGRSSGARRRGSPGGPRPAGRRAARPAGTAATRPRRAPRSAR